MLELRKSQITELLLFSRMEEADDTSEFVFGWDKERHLSEFRKDEVVYLSILNNGVLAGFFILALEPDDEMVEFRRIVVANNHRGIGQRSISAMEDYCRTELKRTKIWLDVLETNSRGRHIYEKLGYKKFKSGEQEGKPLLFYRKDL